MTINPIKAYRKWRTRKQERRDVMLRHQSLLYALKIWGHFQGSKSMKMQLCWAHVFFLYIKYGIAEDGMTVDELLDRDDLGLEYLLPPDKLFPDGPIRL